MNATHVTQALTPFSLHRAALHSNSIAKPAGAPARNELPFRN
jgi:hypothetical protein